jgi:hypothetical protein
MNARKPVLVRIPPGLYEKLRVWAEDEVRSVNSQIEYLLQQAVLSRERSRSSQAGPEVSFGSRSGRGK